MSTTLSQNQLASVLGGLPLPSGSIAEGDLEQALELFRLDDAVPYIGPPLRFRHVTLYCPGYGAAQIRS